MLGDVSHALHRTSMDNGSGQLRMGVVASCELGFFSPTRPTLFGFGPWASVSIRRYLAAGLSHCFGVSPHRGGSLGTRYKLDTFKAKY